MKSNLKVQIGCGLCLPEGWLNFDSTPTLLVSRLPFARPLSGLAMNCGVAPEGSKYRQTLNNLRFTRARYGDITRGLPLPSGSVRQLYASHVIEHLPLAATRQALRECHRLLAPTGVFRLVVPNLRHLVQCYLQQSDVDLNPQAAIRFCLESGLGSECWGPVWSRLRGDRHHLMHDSASLAQLLYEAGFSDVNATKYGESQLDFSDVEDPERWRDPINIGFECRL